MKNNNIFVILVAFVYQTYCIEAPPSLYITKHLAKEPKCSEPIQKRKFEEEKTSEKKLPTKKRLRRSAKKASPVQYKTSARLRLLEEAPVQVVVDHIINQSKAIPRTIAAWNLVQEQHPQELINNDIVLAGYYALEKYASEQAIDLILVALEFPWNTPEIAGQTGYFDLEPLIHDTLGIVAPVIIARWYKKLIQAIQGAKSDAVNTAAFKNAKETLKGLLNSANHTYFSILFKALDQSQRSDYVKKILKAGIRYHSEDIFEAKNRMVKSILEYAASQEDITQLKLKPKSLLKKIQLLLRTGKQ